MMALSIVVCAFLAVPACLAIARLTNARVGGFLIRGSVERAAVLGAATLGAVAMVLQATLLAVALDHAGWSGSMAAVMTIFGPALLGATPWIAGEVLSGPSHSQRGSLVATLSTALATNWVFYALVWPAHAGPASPGMLFAAVAAAVASAGIAAWSYLALRGPAVQGSDESDVQDEHAGLTAHSVARLGWIARPISPAPRAANR